jgi:hypothetical protein
MTSGMTIRFAACIAMACSPCRITWAVEEPAAPEFAALRTLYEGKVKVEVQQPYDGAVADLNVKYTAALNQAQQAAQQAGKLDDVLAVRAEKDAIGTGRGVATADDEQTPPPLKQLRSTYRAAIFRLESERLQRLQVLQAELGKAVDGLTITLTKQGRLDEALAVKQQREAFVAGIAASKLSSEASSPGGKRAMGSMAITLPGSTLKTTPFSVGTVVAGEKVTITPKEVRWSGGGTKKGQFCDWRGHNPNVPLAGSGIPWMALVAAVEKNEFWAKDHTLSFTVPADGMLLLYANDTGGGNEGQADIIVTISPK